MLDEEEKLTSLMEDAVKLHGHLGPFLVIGVRIGSIARKILNPNVKDKNQLCITAEIPLSTPFSCVIDGIQVTTRCTVGNQKLRIKNSRKEITAYFSMQNSDKALKIAVNSKIVAELMSKISKGSTNEELAWNIAHMPESQLLRIEKQ